MALFWTHSVVTVVAPSNPFDVQILVHAKLVQKLRNFAVSSSLSKRCSAVALVLVQHIYRLWCQLCTPCCCTKGAMPWSFALLCAFDHCCRVDVYLCGCYLGTRLGTYRECFLVNLATTCSHTINGYCHGHTRRYVVATESMLNVESPPPFPFCVKMLIVKWYLNIVANLLEALFLEDWWRTVFTRCMFVICNCWSTIVQCVA